MVTTELRAAEILSPIRLAHTAVEKSTSQVLRKWPLISRMKLPINVNIKL